MIEKINMVAAGMLIMFFICVLFPDSDQTIEIEQLNDTISADSKIIMNQNDTIINQNFIINELRKSTQYKVKVTYYCPSEGGINSYGDSSKTAVGEKPIPGYSIAVSRDLTHLLHKNIYILGKGVFYANDLLADKNPYTKKLIRNQIDICIGSLKDIPKQGIFHDVPIAIKF